MKSRSLHKTIGLVLILPMLGWVFTGIIFFTKPGYKAAYEQLKIKAYPLGQPLTIIPNANWQEVKLLNTILGYHLLVKSGKNALHLNPNTFEPIPQPSKEQLSNLINDSIATNPERYGKIATVHDNLFTTNTGVEITINWQTLGLRQTGGDTKLINLMYKIHYLQWTPYPDLNKVLGIIGLVLLLGLTILGCKIYLVGRGKKSN